MTAAPLDDGFDVRGNDPRVAEALGGRAGAPPPGQEQQNAHQGAPPPPEPEGEPFFELPELETFSTLAVARGFQILAVRTQNGAWQDVSTRHSGRLGRYLGRVLHDVLPRPAQQMTPEQRARVLLVLALFFAVIDGFMQPRSPVQNEPKDVNPTIDVDNDAETGATVDSNEDDVWTES